MIKPMTMPEVVAELREMYESYCESGSGGGHCLAEGVRKLHNRLDKEQDELVSSVVSKPPP
jgi:hypothetical protein